jgi:hypothetical protein
MPENTGRMSVAALKKQGRPVKAAPFVLQSELQGDSHLALEPECVRSEKKPPRQLLAKNLLRFIHFSTVYLVYETFAFFVMLKSLKIEKQ